MQNINPVETYNFLSEKSKFILNSLNNSLFNLPKEAQKEFQKNELYFKIFDDEFLIQTKINPYSETIYFETKGLVEDDVILDVTNKTELVDANLTAIISYFIHGVQRNLVIDFNNNTVPFSFEDIDSINDFTEEYKEVIMAYLQDKYMA